MHSIMTRLVNELESNTEVEVVRWASPVPFFGRITEATVATVGINPSIREFVAPDGSELMGEDRRLPTLASLALGDWARADGGDIRAMTEACLSYFERNPYRLWFDVLDRLLHLSGCSYYGKQPAAHLDLFAHATGTRWASLPQTLRKRLVARGRTALAEVIRDSPIEILVLNGRSVVNEFSAAAQFELSATSVPAWTLPRKTGPGVAGISYSGTITSMAGIAFDREVQIIGFNHNLQSSFGVTNSVVQRIAQAVGEVVGDARARTAR